VRFSRISVRSLDLLVVAAQPVIRHRSIFDPCHISSTLVPVREGILYRTIPSRACILRFRFWVLPLPSAVLRISRSGHSARVFFPFCTFLFVLRQFLAPLFFIFPLFSKKQALTLFFLPFFVASFLLLSFVPTIQSERGDDMPKKKRSTDVETEKATLGNRARERASSERPLRSFRCSPFFLSAWSAYSGSDHPGSALPSAVASRDSIFRFSHCPDDQVVWSNEPMSHLIALSFSSSSSHPCDAFSSISTWKGDEERALQGSDWLPCSQGLSTKPVKTLSPFCFFFFLLPFCLTRIEWPKKRPFSIPYFFPLVSQWR
jgi:hypothetical protein